MAPPHPCGAGGDSAIASPLLRAAPRVPGLGLVHALSGRQWDAWLPPAPYGGKVTRALIDRPWRDGPSG